MSALGTETARSKALRVLDQHHIFFLMLGAIQTTGSYDPEENMVYFQEQMTADEYSVVEAFLKWVHEMDFTFGDANYKGILKQYLTTI